MDIIMIVFGILSIIIGATLIIIQEINLTPRQKLQRKIDKIKRIR